MANTSFRRKLRKNDIPSEKLLWYRIRNRQLNSRKFRRQHPIDPYIVDFCCIELKLVVEVDGDTHSGKELSDAVRQAFLEAQGWRVIRFTNRDVVENMSGVMEVLWKATSDDVNAPSP